MKFIAYLIFSLSCLAFVNVASSVQIDGPLDPKPPGEEGKGKDDL